MQKGTYVALASTQQPIDQKADNRQMGTAAAKDKEVLFDPSNLDKKHQISSNLKPK
jgi:hypothetical protein